MSKREKVVAEETETEVVDLKAEPVAKTAEIVTLKIDGAEYALRKLTGLTVTAEVIKEADPARLRVWIEEGAKGAAEGGNPLIATRQLVNLGDPLEVQRALWSCEEELIRILETHPVTG